MVTLCCNHVTASVDWSSIIQCVAESVSALIAVSALVVAVFTALYAKREYDRMVKHKQCEVFAQYNERYENSEYIQKIVKYCTVKTRLKKDIPTVHDKEMFLRFFEELDFMIQKDYITEEQVGNYFAYYFLLLWNDTSFFWDADMLNPYTTLEGAQKSPEWKAARHLFNCLKKKWYTDEIKNYLYPDIANQQKKRAKKKETNDK